MRISRYTEKAFYRHFFSVITAGWLVVGGKLFSAIVGELNSNNPYIYLLVTKLCLHTLYKGFPTVLLATSTSRHK